MAFSAQNLENRTKRFAIAIAGAARDEPVTISQRICGQIADRV